MKTTRIAACILVGHLWASSTIAMAQAYHDVSRDYLSGANPGKVWSYGWKPSLTGTFTLLGNHQAQPVLPGSGWEFWSRDIGTPTSVYRTTGSTTLYSDGGAGVYPPGSVWFGPGVEPSQDRFGVIRFTPAQGGKFRIGVEVRTRMDAGGSDADFHVLHNTVELFGTNIVPVSSATFTNELTLNDGDTIDFLCGRGDDGKEYGGGLKIAARIWRIGDVSIRFSQVEICWDTSINELYQVQYRSLVTTNQWLPLHSGYFPGTGSPLCTNDVISVDGERRFYRVVTSTNGMPSPQR